MKLSQLPKMTDLKTLLIGEPGAGKTCFSTSFPTPIYSFDFDGKINSAARHHDAARIDEIECDSYRAGGFDEAAPIFDLFDERFNALEAASKKGQLQYKTVILDSLTPFGDILLKACMKRFPTNRVRPQMPSQSDYHTLSLEFKNYLNRFLALKANIVVTAHIQIMKDDYTGEILRMAQTVGSKLPKWLPTIFEEVYRCYRQDKGTQKAYIADTANGKYACRTQIPGLPGVITQDYKSLVTGGNK